MSQEKVNRYKEQKANRKEIMAREKKQKKTVQLIVGIVAVVLICWLGYSVYDMATRPDTSAVEIDSTALDEYLQTLEEE